MELNDRQFKIDLGPRANHDHEHRVDRARKVHEEYGMLPPQKGVAPGGYYDQPSSGVRQQALPGMEMSVQDHLGALGKATGTRAMIDSGKISHRMMLMEPYTETTSSGYSYEGETERSHLSYNNKRGPERLPDSGNKFEPEYHPGEIRMIKSGRPGDASAMLETADRLAAEHGMPYPKHSDDRTPLGMQWSQKQMKARGEKVW